MPNLSVKELIRGASATQAETKEPRLFNVVFFNDDTTPMNFVIDVLISMYGHHRTQAETVTLEIHHQGTAVAGTYPLEIAEAKVTETCACARRSGYPLHCTAQPIPSSIHNSQ